MNAQLHLTIHGAVADVVLALIRERFDHVTARTVPGPGTVVTVTGIDQAGERALLNLLWDTGHAIESLSSTDPEPPASPRVT